MVSVCVERKARNMVIKRQNEEVVRINRQLQLARDRAVAAEKAKSYFFSCISHDVRTPLNAIIGYTELLKKGISDEKERDGACDAITTSGRSLLQLVSSMVDLARLESDTLVIEPVLTDLNVQADKILHSFDVSVAGKAVRLLGEWDGNMPYLKVDPKRIWQILFHLTDNAVKYTEEGEIVLKLVFEREDAKKGILSITISDTGSGMDEETRKRIMQPFASADEDYRNHQVGAGLGITICRHLIERMNGTLELKSEPGSGTVFTIRIPDIAFSERTNSFPRPGSMIDFHGKKREQLHVLIVDDVPLNISILRTMLRKNGVSDIVTSVNGKDALRKIRTSVKQFDLVLTDLWMPEMDGRVLLQELRADSRFKSLNVIAITADVDAKEECMKLGFSDVISNPSPSRRSSTTSRRHPANSPADHSRDKKTASQPSSRHKETPARLSRKSDLVTEADGYRWSGCFFGSAVHSKDGERSVSEIRLCLRRGIDRNRNDIFGLRAFGALTDGELDELPFLQGTVAFRLDGAVVDENVLRAFTLDESKSFGVVEPLDFALFAFAHVKPSILLLPGGC